MGRLSKHLGEGGVIEIEGESYTLKSLGTQHLPVFMKVMKNFSHLKEGSSVEEVMKGMTDESLISIRELIDKTLEISLPEEPQEDREQFGLKYMMVLLPKIFEINMIQGEGDNRVGKLKEKLNAVPTTLSGKKD